ncbi:PaaI family thioesterase [Ideonella sp. A 288]|uniref:PaaI family thioesterase n=1 Tax=Ideonella sp. A 288 TaxID=1962181 RepID=UPI001F35A60D|nr:PaaI family thioesterase [Ideonella sp. A 288]
MADPVGMSLSSLQEMLDSPLFAAWVRDLALRVAEVRPGEVHLALPVTARHVHGGGVVCGQTLMAAADTAMVLAVSSQLGGFQPMTTVQLQTSFLRPVPGTDTEARVIARVLRLGKSLAFGEIEVHDASGRLAAHSTTTYALL